MPCVHDYAFPGFGGWAGTWALHWLEEQLILPGAVVHNNIIWLCTSYMYYWDDSECVLWRQVCER